MGQATLAWQSDYTQFYLVDPGDGDVTAPVEITAEVEARSLFVPPSGLVVYTKTARPTHRKTGAPEEIRTPDP